MNRSTLAFIAVGIAFSACEMPATQSNNSTASTAVNSSNTVKTDGPKMAPPTDLQALAAKIVTQSAGVKEGEVVLVNGGVRDLELLENIVTEVRKVGGEPLLTIGTERIAKKSFTDVSEKYDSKEDKLGMAFAKIVNVSINVDSGETEALLADIPPARLAARAKAGEPVAKEFIANKVRSVSVGNGLYPTEWRAKRFEMPLDAFSKLFWEGVNTDYTALQATGEKARTALTGKEIEITHPNGTNLKVAIESKPAYISDGVISADDIAKGNFEVFLPAGEAAVITAANSGTGKFVVEREYFNGKEIRNLTYNFENGKLTSMAGEGEGFAAMKADYDARGAGKELLGFVDLGINPSYTLAPNSKYGNWVSAGMVSIGTGGNAWAGGTNTIGGGVVGQLPGATVKIDGRTIVENGVLKL